MPDPSAPPRALSDVLRDSSSRLAQTGVLDPVVDAELLAGHVLGLPRGAVQAAVIRGDQRGGGAGSAGFVWMRSTPSAPKSIGAA